MKITHSMPESVVRELDEFVRNTNPPSDRSKTIVFAIKMYLESRKNANKGGSFHA